MKESGYTNWGPHCNWNIMMPQSCIRNMFWLIEEAQSKLNQKIERNAKSYNRLAVHTRKWILITQEYILLLMSDIQSGQSAQQLSHNYSRGQQLLESRAFENKDCKEVHKARGSLALGYTALLRGSEGHESIPRVRLASK